MVNWEPGLEKHLEFSHKAKCEAGGERACVQKQSNCVSLSMSSRHCVTEWLQIWIILSISWNGHCPDLMFCKASNLQFCLTSLIATWLCFLLVFLFSSPPLPVCVCKQLLVFLFLLLINRALLQRCVTAHWQACDSPATRTACPSQPNLPKRCWRLAVWSRPFHLYSLFLSG